MGIASKMDFVEKKICELLPKEVKTFAVCGNPVCHTLMWHQCKVTHKKTTAGMQEVVCLI